MDLDWILFDADGVIQRTKDGWLEQLTAAGGDRGEEFVLAVFAAEMACVTGQDFQAAMDRAAGRLRHRPAADGGDRSGVLDRGRPDHARRRTRTAGTRLSVRPGHQPAEPPRHATCAVSSGSPTVFDEQFYSWELGVAKPDPGYFTAILDRIERPADRVLFLDDNADNVEGARSVGLPAELFPRDGGLAALQTDPARPRRTDVTVRVGISGWTYAPWRGEFYPKGLRQRDELSYVAERLNSVEINGSFYALQRRSSYQTWGAQVPEDFVFAVKGGRFITHMKKLTDIATPMANFLASGPLALDGKLGPLLWQLPPTLGFDAERMDRFFADLPAHRRRGRRTGRGP